jgi:predicted RNA-binding protein
VKHPDLGFAVVRGFAGGRLFLEWENDRAVAAGVCETVLQLHDLLEVVEGSERTVSRVDLDGHKINLEVAPCALLESYGFRFGDLVLGIDGFAFVCGEFDVKMVVRDVLGNERVATEPTQFSLVRRCGEVTIVPKRAYDGSIVDVDVGVQPEQERLPGDRVAFEGGFGTVVGNSDKGLVVQTDDAKRVNRGVSLVSGPTRLLRRIEAGMKKVKGFLAGDIVTRADAFYVVGLSGSDLESVEGRVMGEVDDETTLVLRADWPTEGARVVGRKMAMTLSDSAFHGLRVLPGDVVLRDDDVWTILGAIPGSDVWCSDCKEDFTLPGCVFMDPEAVLLIETIYSRIISSASG